jgi:hypothetical protein
MMKLSCRLLSPSLFRPYPLVILNPSIQDILEAQREALALLKTEERIRSLELLIASPITTAYEKENCTKALKLFKCYLAMEGS